MRNTTARRKVKTGNFARKDTDYVIVNALVRDHISIVILQYIPAIVRPIYVGNTTTRHIYVY